MTLLCPIDASPLQPAEAHHVPHHTCPKCHGGWFELDEFEKLEASSADAFALEGTLEYFPRPASLKCPSCGKTMVAFDYRGNDLELDACNEEHGFWLNTGAAERVRTLMRRREQDLERSGHAQRIWKEERERGFAPDFIGKLRRFFRG